MRSMRRGVLAVSLGSLIGACTSEQPDARPTVAVIEVVDETYRIELATPELVDHARRLMAGEELASIPSAGSCAMTPA